MGTVVVVFAGLCVGALMALADIPRTRYLVWFCAAAVGLVLTAVFVESRNGSWFDGSLFAASALVGASVYGAELWRRLGLREAYSYWELIWMTTLRPGYLRASWKQAKEE